MTIETNSDQTSKKSKILVLGATGGAGRHIVAQALARGYEVTALAREGP